MDLHLMKQIDKQADRIGKPAVAKVLKGAGKALPVVGQKVIARKG